MPLKRAPKDSSLNRFQQMQQDAAVNLQEQAEFERRRWNLLAWARQGKLTPRVSVGHILGELCDPQLPVWHCYNTQTAQKWKRGNCKSCAFFESELGVWSLSLKMLPRQWLKKWTITFWGKVSWNARFMSSEKYPKTFLRTRIFHFQRHHVLLMEQDQKK